MDLLRTLLIYMSMVFISSVQTAPEPSLAPASTAFVEATATATPEPTPSPTPVPTPALTPNPAYKTIRVGDNGDGVRDMQAKLAEYGYYTGEIDGRFGNQTRRAVEQFQYNQGLTVDGIAGRFTLTVLYESADVRVAPTPTPAPTEETLATARPQDDETPIPIGGETDAPTDEPTTAPTDAPATDAPTDELALTSSTDAPTDAPTTAPTDEPTTVPTDAPATDAPTTAPTDEPTTAPTDAPATDAPTTAPTDAPTTTAPTAPPTTAPTPVATFMPMEGYAISLAGEDEALYSKAADDPTDTLLEPYAFGDSVYVPLLRILDKAGVLVIPNETIDLSEYAFAIGNDVYRIAFSEDRAGNPIDLRAFMNNDAQTLPSEEIYVAHGEIYLPMESVESLVGLSFDLDDAQKRLLVAMPAAQPTETAAS